MSFLVDLSSLKNCFKLRGNTWLLAPDQDSNLWALVLQLLRSPAMERQRCPQAGLVAGQFQFQTIMLHESISTSLLVRHPTVAGNALFLNRISSGSPAGGDPRRLSVIQLLIYHKSIA